MRERTGAAARDQRRRRRCGGDVAQELEIETIEHAVPHDGGDDEPLDPEAGEPRRQLGRGWPAGFRPTTRSRLPSLDVDAGGDPIGAEGAHGFAGERRTLDRGRSEDGARRAGLERALQLDQGADPASDLDGNQRGGLDDLREHAGLASLAERAMPLAER